MGRSRAAWAPSRSHAAAFIFSVASLVGARSADAAGAPAYIAEIMPPASCLAAPDRACLLVAYENVVSRYENRAESTKIGSLRLFMAIGGGLNDPGADALLTRYHPYWTADRLKARRAELAPKGANPPARSKNDIDAPSPSELPAEQARILATADLHGRMWRTNAVINALAKARRFGEAEKLLTVVQKSMRGKDSTLRDYMAVTAARSFAEVGEWPSWSRSMVAGGYVRMMAEARRDSDPEVDPTEVGILEPLRLGIPIKDLLPWVARAKDPAFRDELLTQIADAVFERGRVAAWTSDVGGFRRYVVAATAKGELLSYPDYSGSDQALLGFCYREEKQRGDRVLALVAALQDAIKPPPEDTAPARDTVRGRVLIALADALVRAEK